MTVLFALISFAALREFVTLTYTRRSDHWVLLGMFGIVIPFQYWLVWTELVRALHHLHPGLLLPAHAGVHRASRRHGALP